MQSPRSSREARNDHAGEMPLTPEEIANKRFLTSFRGYAKWEVEQFLHDVALDYRRAVGIAQWSLERGTSTAPPVFPSPAQQRPAVVVQPQLDRSLAPQPQVAATRPQAAQPVPADVGTMAALDQINRALESLHRSVNNISVDVNATKQRLTQLETQNTRAPQPTQAWWPPESPVSLVTRR